MKYFKILKNNLIYSYIIFGFIIFCILFLLNFFYQKYVLDLSLGHKYDVSAIQYNDFKNKTFHPVLAYVFSKEIKNTHRVKNVNVESPGITLKKRKSELSFRLILNKYVDEKRLENLVNKIYLDHLNLIISEFEKNSNLYNFEILKNQYNNYKLLKIDKAYESFLNEAFFKKYPPQKCDKNKEYCLKLYNDYYMLILEYLKNGNPNVQKLLYSNKNQNLSLNEIYTDFNLNKNLIDNLNLSPELFASLKNQFFKEKFEKLVNSEFFSSYAFDYCLNFSITCLRDISDDFNKILHEHKIETRHKYNVKYILKVETKEFHLIPAIIKILGFSIMLTYILFILTNKFFREKLK